MVYIPKDSILLKLPLCLEGERIALHEMIEDAGVEWPYKHSFSIEKNVIKTAATFLGSEPRAPMFHFSNFVHTALPIRQPNPTELIWKRENGQFELIVSSGHAPTTEGMKAVGLPYGTKARLILLYIVDQIRTSPSDKNQISMGQSLSDFMKRLGLNISGGEYGSIKAVKEQAARLARCRFEFKYPTKWDNEFQVLDYSFSGTQLWKVSEDEQWPKSITISPEFRDSVHAHSFAVDTVAISLLKQNAMAFDWYIFLAFRTRERTNFERSKFLPWACISKQMGSRYRRMADFKRNTIRALKFVGAVYPNLTLTVTHQGITLEAPSSQLFPEKILHFPKQYLTTRKDLLSPGQSELFTEE